MPKEREVEEEVEEVSEVVSEDHSTTSKEPCIKFSGFVICEGRVYNFVVGRRTILGLVVKIEKRFMRIIVTTERGKALIDLRKVSIIEEIKE